VSAVVRSGSADARGAGDGRTGRLWIGVLGPLLVTRDGAEVPLGPVSQRAVLALAALGQLGRREPAFDALWGDTPPATAVAVLQTYVSRLRSLLGPASDGGRILVRAGSGYRLRVAADELDLHVFRRLVDTARAAGDTAGACDAYEQALALWRGDPAEDIGTLQTHPAVTALAAERVAVTLEYAELAEATGWHNRVLAHLRGLVSRDPLDELSHARLMVALAGCGRQAEALRLYEELRRRLDEQLGVSPGSELRGAHARVLRQEVKAAGADDDWRPVFQLPAAVADFTGRTRDFEKLISAITPGDGQQGVPVAVVWGAPGVGKTTLALQAAHKAGIRFPGGQLWVHLAGTSARPRDPGDVLADFLRALGVPGPAIPGDISGRAAQYRSRLAGRKVLIVADDAASPAQVLPLLPGTAGCALLVTSRTQLDEPAGAKLLPLDAMPPDDAVGLLTRMVGGQRVAAEPKAALDLVKACGALPLALRVIGGRMAARPDWPVSAALRRLTGEQNRLRELEAGDLSVSASIESSYRSLPERTRRAFRRLALLGPSDFAEWVPGVLLGEADPFLVTGELVSRSLLTAAGADGRGEPRYRLHDLLRDYAGERLNDDDAAASKAAMHRALTAWLQLARLASAQLPPEPHFAPPPDRGPSGPLPAGIAAELTRDADAWFASERDNLRAAIEHTCTPGQWELAAQLAACLSSCRRVHDPLDEERLWRAIAAAADQAGDEAGTAEASCRAGAATARRGHSAEAAALLDICVQRLAGVDMPGYLGIALYWRAGCALDLGDYETARRTAERGRAVARQADDHIAELYNTQLLGHALANAGQHEAAIAEAELAVSMAAELGFNDGPAVHTLAFACRIAGQHQRALKLSATLVESACAGNDPIAHSSALVLMADLYQDMGRFHNALDALDQAEPAFRSSHYGRRLALCLLKQGYAHQALGSDQAVPVLEESLRMFTEMQLPHRVEEAQEILSQCKRSNQ
jgi:DNA-binding SARP family transcriptional activator